MSSAMNGVVFQTSTIRTATIAVSGLAVQAIFWLIRPRLRKMSFKMPNWSLSIQAHILADTMVGMAQGIKMAARTRPRPGKLAFSTSATIRPSTVSIETDRRVNRSVFQTAPPPRRVDQQPAPNGAAALQRDPGEIVVKADELGTGEVVERSVGEAEIDRPDERPTGHHGENEKCRCQKDPGGAGTLGAEIGARCRSGRNGRTPLWMGMSVMGSPPEKR